MLELMLLICLLPILALIIIAICVRRPSARGKRGEELVKWEIGADIENEQYTINNLILLHDGKSSQIDHVVINPRGIFVIETKNYSGDIYGFENQLEWTQVLSKGRAKNRFYNPIKQNATHVYNVKRIVGNLPVRSLVVFVQNNTCHIEARNVIPLSKLKSALSRGKNVLTVDQIKTAYHLLLQNRASISNQEHVQNIKEQQRKIEEGICPRCAGRLVLRKGKYGEFLGCSNYPNCRFTKKFDDGFFS